MQKPLFWRLCWAAAAAFAIRAVYTDWLQLRGTRLDRAVANARHDVGVIGDARFSLLRGHVPATAMVGYLAARTGGSLHKAYIWDPQSGTVVYRVPRAGVEDMLRLNYVLAQYALAPLVIDTSAQQHLVVADFPSDAALLETIKGKRLVVVDWLGHAAPGLALLKNLDVPATQSAEEAKP